MEASQLKRSLGMGFVDAVKTCFTKYFDFNGRARRSEYWWFVLFIVIAYLAIGIIGGGLNLGDTIQVVAGVFNLAILIPSLAVTVRRFHDLDKSGWFILINFIPLVGPFIVLYWMTQPGTEGSNRFGL
jgi:uncharacterized membrane protein YhaH (DUF805 family)